MGMSFVGEEHGNGRCHHRVGTTVRILCGVSHICTHLPPHLTVAPDMWNKHRGDQLRRSSFGSSDCTDGKFPSNETTRQAACNSHVRDRVEL